MSAEGASNLSPFAGVVFNAHIFGRNLAHLHRPGPDDEDDNLQGEFWKRHRHIDNTLSKTLLLLPTHLRLPKGIRDPNIIFINMSIHTSTICLHQAAIFKLEQKKLPQALIDQSSTRCFLAATEIVKIVKMIAYGNCSGVCTVPSMQRPRIDHLFQMNPFIAFCLYVCARVFIQVVKKSPGQKDVRALLEFIIAAMQQFKRINPLSESFLVQLSLDLQGTGMDSLQQKTSQSTSTVSNPLFVVSDPRTASWFSSRTYRMLISDRRNGTHDMDALRC